MSNNSDKEDLNEPFIHVEKKDEENFIAQIDYPENDKEDFLYPKSPSTDRRIYDLPVSENTNKYVIKKLLIVCVVCTILMIAEVIGGALAGSLAIMTDAAHLFSDLSGFFISIFSLWLSRKPSTNVLSFGYHRAEIIGALASVMIIYGLTIWLIYEAFQRILHMNFNINE